MSGGGELPPRIIFPDSPDSPGMSPRFSRKAFSELAGSYYAIPLAGDLLELEIEPLTESEALRVLRFPSKLLQKIMAETEEFAFSIAFRVNPIGTVPNRRTSFRSDPKDLDSKTKTNASSAGAMGYMPELAAFTPAQINLHDHQAGAFMEGAKDLNENKVSSFSEKYYNVRKKFMGKVSPYAETEEARVKLGEIKTTPDGRITYFVSVPEYEYVIQGGESKKIATNENITKHYIQATESILSIINNINNGIYENYELKKDPEGKLMLYVTTDKIQQGQSPEKQTFQFDLTNLIKPPDDIDIVRDTPKETSAKSSIIAAIQSTLESGKLLDINCQVPVSFKIQDNGSDYFPLMVQAGKTGQPITGDTDQSYISIPLNMPNVAFKAYNCLKPESHADMVTGFKIMIARLQLDDNAFAAYLKTVKDSSIPADQDKIKFLIHKFDLKYHMKSGEMLKNDPAVKLIVGILNRRTNEGTTVAESMIEKLDHDLANPGDMLVLDRVGAMSMGDLMVDMILKDPNLVHGKETMNPSPEAITGVLHVYKGDLYRTNTERGYLDFIMLDPENLKNKSLDFHPSYIRDRSQDKDFESLSAEEKENRKDLSEYWLDLIEIQALHYINNFAINDQQEMLQNYINRSTKYFITKSESSAIALQKRLHPNLDLTDGGRAQRLESLILKRQEQIEKRVDEGKISEEVFKRFKAPNAPKLKS